MGRARAITPEVAKHICEALAKGNHVQTACDLVGIHKDTHYEEMKRNTDYSDAIKKAVAEGEAKTLGVIADATPKFWQAAAWMLERRFPDRWGRKDKVEMVDAEPEIRKRAEELGLDPDEAVAKYQDEKRKRLQGGRAA